VDKALAAEFTLLLSVPLVLQYEAVLKRDEHRAVHKLADPQLDQMVGALVRVAAPVQIRFLWRPVLSDPSDDMVLETAVNGQGNLLVTFNLDHFARATRMFAHRTLRPREALQLVRGHGKR
jgi:predicted nucleic acid-binding protein